MQFHLQQFAANDIWPEGGWSLYRITGEEIASRTIWERKDNDFEVTERWPWPGYIGCFTTLDQVMEEIRKQQ